MKVGGQGKSGNVRSEVIKSARRTRSTEVAKWDSGLGLYKVPSALVPSI